MHRRFILKSLPIHPGFIAMCSDTKVNSWSKVSKLGEGKKRGPRSLIVMNWEVFIVCLSLRKILTALWNRGNFFGNFVGKLKAIFLVHGNGGSADLGRWAMSKLKTNLMTEAGYRKELIWAPTYLGRNILDN